MYLRDLQSKSENGDYAVKTDCWAGCCKPDVESVSVSGSDEVRRALDPHAFANTDVRPACGGAESKALDRARVAERVTFGEVTARSQVRRPTSSRKSPSRRASSYFVPSPVSARV